MPVEEIPFNAGQASGMEQLAGAPPAMINSLTDLGGVRRPRPGIATWSGFPSTIPHASPVDAMAVFDGYVVYVTRDRKLWAALDGTVLSLSDATPTTKLDGGTRPVLLPTRTRLIAVGGGVPQKWSGTGLSARLGGSPPTMSFISGIATRLVGSVADTSGIIRWSGLGESVGHETWDALNFTEAEARPDPLVAVADNTNELFAFGSKTLQVFSPDPTVGFAPGRALNLGLLAPGSFIAVDDTFAFLDSERRFVITDGRSFSDENVISKPIEATLRPLTAADCWGFRMRLDRWDACVWMFPTDGIGYIWNRRSGSWSEWRAFWETGYGAPNITSALAWPEQNLFLVGLSTGQIARLDSMAHTDLGEVLKVELVSGFVDRGTDNYKQCQAVKFTFRRGQTAGEAPVVQISYRDGLGPFSSPATFSLGQPGDYTPTVEMRSEGTYRRREWKLEYTSDADLSFVGAREQFRVLEN